MLFKRELISPFPLLKCFRRDVYRRCFKGLNLTNKKVEEIKKNMNGKRKSEKIDKRSLHLGEKVDALFYGREVNQFIEMRKMFQRQYAEKTPCYLIFNGHLFVSM
jgi:hypothetical protein